MYHKSINSLVTEIRLAQAGTKVEQDGIVTRLFYRTGGYYAAAILWKYIHLKPNEISLLCAALAIFSVFVAWFYPSICIISIFLLLIGCLDNADGALARYLQVAGPKGELADAIGGYIVLWCTPFIAWLMMFGEDQRLTITGLIWGFFSAVVVAFQYLGRSIYQKSMEYNFDGEKIKEKNNSLPKKMKNIQGNLNFCGFMFPVFILSWIFGMPIIGWLYVVSLLFLIGSFGLLLGIKRAMS